MFWPIFTALLVIFIIYCVKKSIRPRDFPPGPPCFGVLGSLPYLDVRNLTRSFNKLTDKYGDVFSIFIGTKPVVVINTPEAIKEAFERPEFSGRPGNFSGTFFQKGRTGITTTEGAHWKSQRSFLKEYLDKITSSSSQGFQDIMMDEVTDLKTDLNKKVDEPLAVSYKLNVCIINILWNLTCGRRLHAQQQEFQTVYECVDKITQFMSRAAIFSFLPILTKILPESITKMEKGRYYRNRFHEVSEKWIREHRQDYRGNRTGDMQDNYLEHVNKGEVFFTEQGLAAILREIFIIGSESESVMLRWAVRILSCHPEVQDKAAEELDRVVGRGVEITWDKRNDLPYSMAVIKEIQRFADIAPTGLMHKTVCDTSLRGFSLPANTLIMANISGCHRSPKHWANPDQFCPEHFLEDGKLIENKVGFLPYGVGERICPGMELANMEMFLIITNILSTYRLCLVDGDDGRIGTQFKSGTAVLRNPKPYRVIFKLRD
eukprot:TRINITY_DN4649_c0_g2_i1.p1 TRINITY_DN4649_c0_g2~~TRINITY_DN4649_c0_g2_i1.p1  ORF type:complete len:489 (+),score=168.74 TRINITY_DN4649_c0_g2_i1:31-1497(+)